MFNNKVMSQGYLDNDAPHLWQRLIYTIVGSIIIIPPLVFLTAQLVKSIKLGLIRQRKYLILSFFLCLELAFVLRLLYFYSWSEFHLPAPLYGIFCFFPGVMTSTAALLFLQSMLNSLDEVCLTVKEEKFSKLRFALIALMILLWIASIAGYSGVAYTSDGPQPNHDFWAKIFFITGVIYNIAACAFLVIVTVYYISKLKKFECTYKDKKNVVYLMLVATIIQLVLRVIIQILNNNVMLQLQEDAIKGGITFHIVGCCYFLLSELVPAVCYIIYLKKETQTRQMVDSQISDTTEANRKSISLLGSWEY